MQLLARKLTVEPVWKSLGQAIEVRGTVCFFLDALHVPRDGAAIAWSKSFYLYLYLAL